MFMAVICVLRPLRSHQDFQQFVSQQLRIHYFEKELQRTVLLYHLELAKVWATDLTPVYYILAHQHSKRGSSARDPVDLFRSLLLMELTHAKSVDDWVKTMRAHPIWAIYSGFSPDNVPGVGTFYDFQNRLWLAEAPHLSSKIRKPKRKPKKGKKKGEKAPLRKPGIVGRLTSRFGVPLLNDTLNALKKTIIWNPEAKSAVPELGTLPNVFNQSGPNFASLFFPGLFLMPKFPFPATRPLGDVRESGEVLHKIFLAPEP